MHNLYMVKTDRSSSLAILEAKSKIFETGVAKSGRGTISLVWTLRCRFAGTQWWETSVNLFLFAGYLLLVNMANAEDFTAVPMCMWCGSSGWDVAGLLRAMKTSVAANRRAAWFAAGFQCGFGVVTIYNTIGEDT